ncbi:hypothetical protein MUP01_11265 [Candidatus Bathyarchaeota archaeon]|nr:hypothetical protein [Candidatus Bathyarchaeota archaeon]
MLIKNSLAGFAIVAMLVLGTISLVVSISYDSSILALVGLGLCFWGVLLLYITPEEFTRKILQEVSLSPALTTLNLMIQELRYKGNPTYLPPKYFTSPETTKVYVSKRKGANLPTPEQIQEYKDQPVARTKQGMLFTPPGIQLSKLLERSLGKSFIRTNLKGLQQNLPRLFIENLEIAENLEMQVEDDLTRRKEDHHTSQTPTKNTIIHVRIAKPFCADISQEAEIPLSSVALVGDPISSAIAIALTKATSKPIRIMDTKNSEDGNVLEATYETIEE